MDQLVAQIRALVAKHRFLLAVGSVALVVVIASAWVAIPARKQRAVLAAEDARLGALIKSSNLWVTRFEPASSEESAIWQQTASEVASLGVRPSERLTLAQIIARRAEDAGFDAAHIKFVPSDGAAAPPPRQVAGVSFNPASYQLEVSGIGSLSTLSRFLEALPPAVELRSASLTGVSTGVSASLTLSVFEPAGGNAK